MSRDNDSLFALALTSPWWLNFCVAAGLFLFSKYLLVTNNSPVQQIFSVVPQFVALFFFFAGVVSGIKEFLSKSKQRKIGEEGTGRAAQTKEKVAPGYYYNRKEMFTDAEAAFLRVLDTAVGREYRVFSKVRMADLLTPSRNHHRGFVDWHSAFNKVKSKHVDFVLCDTTSLKPVLGLELDDKSHDDEDRQKRDEFVNDAFDKAGIPLSRVRVRRSYDVEGLQNLIKNAIKEEIHVVEPERTIMDETTRELAEIPIQGTSSAKEVPYKFQ